MVCFGSADARQMVTDDDDVAFPIRGEVEFANGSLLLQNPFDPGQLASDGHDLGWLGAFEAPNAHESAQGSMMRDEGIGDGADDAGRSSPQASIEDVLQPDHVGGAVGSGFVVHAMIRCHGHHRSERIEPTKAHVQGPIETIGLRLTGSISVLNPIGQG